VGLDIDGLGMSSTITAHRDSAVRAAARPSSFAKGSRVSTSRIVNYDTTDSDRDAKPDKTEDDPGFRATIAVLIFSYQIASAFLSLFPQRHLTRILLHIHLRLPAQSA
jgi:hypothetical protein